MVELKGRNQRSEVRGRRSEKMEMIMMSINESWVWLGPLLVFCFVVVLIAQVVDVFTAEDAENPPHSRRPSAEES